MKIYLYFTLLLLISGYGCAPTNIQTFEPFQLSSAVVLPTKSEVAGDKYNVYLDVEEFKGDAVNDTKMSLHGIMRSALEKILLDIDNVVFVPSKEEADYHVQSKLTTARLSSNVIEGKTISYAEILGRIKIFRGENKDLVEVIQFEDNASEGVQNTQNRDVILNKAITDSIQFGAGEKLTKIFSAKGFILSGRKDGDDYIFEVTMGRDKLNVGDMVEVHTIERIENPLTNEIEENDRIMATALVVDNSGSKRSWIQVKNNGEHIRLGDFVRFSEKSGSGIGKAWNKLTKKTNALFKNIGK